MSVIKKERILLKNVFKKAKFNNVLTGQTCSGRLEPLNAKLQRPCVRITTCVQVVFKTVFAQQFRIIRPIMCNTLTAAILVYFHSVHCHRQEVSVTTFVKCFLVFSGVSL